MIVMEEITYPLIKISSDANFIDVSDSSSVSDLPLSSGTVGMQYFTVAVDSANRILINLPQSKINGVPTYNWLMLDNTVVNYPVGDILDINCSYNYTRLSSIIHITVLTSAGIYEYTVLHASPGVGTPVYGWVNINPPAEVPIFIG